jgi:hypothetical protein
LFDGKARKSPIAKTKRKPGKIGKIYFNEHKDGIITIKISKVSVPKHENSIVAMDPMATHCRKLIVTGIYQANSYQKFVMSY